MARGHRLVGEVARRGGAFVCDTGPLVYRLERSGQRRVRDAVDVLFGEVEAGEIGCFVSTFSAGELLVHPHRAGVPAVSLADGFLRSPFIGLVSPTLAIVHGAARLVARRATPRLGDAIIAATAAELRIPLVTTDRRLARAVGAILVQDHLAPV